MMSRIFLTVINMSISASYLVLAILLFRLLLKKAPKWITAALWGLVGIRLIFPFSVESIFSLIPSAEVVSPGIMMDPTPNVHTGIPVMDDSLNPFIGGAFTPAPGDSANPLQIWIPVFATVWLIGIAVMLVYALISYVGVKRKIGTAVRLWDNIYQSENVVTPFVLGLIRPKIYLPFRMNEKDMGYVVAHETAHIRRWDHLWKPFGFLILALHWFNPLMWLGYVLLCRDVELACDEKVIGALDREARAEYSETLLACSVNRRMLSACPLAFGGSDVKKRVRSVLCYQKPALWIIIATMILCAVLAVCFLTDPVDQGIKSISVEEVSYAETDLKIGYSYPTGSYSVRLVDSEEGEYCGDGVKDYDGSLGAHRILIMFGDMEPSKKFTETYPVGEVIELASAPIRMRMKYVYPQDHGFALYVGFDIPVAVKQIDDGKCNALGGFIEIPVFLYKIDLIYDSPNYSSLITPSDVEIEDGALYVIEDGKREFLGFLTEKKLDRSNFDVLIGKYDGFDFPRHAKGLRENNRIAYAVTPNQKGIIYVMRQKSGETLIVYGSETEIRSIFRTDL